MLWITASVDLLYLHTSVLFCPRLQGLISIDCGEEQRGWDSPLALPSELISCQHFPRDTARARLNQMWAALNESQPPQLCVCITQEHIVHTDHCKRKESYRLNSMKKAPSFESITFIRAHQKRVKYERWYRGWLTYMSMIYYNSGALLIHMQISLLPFWASLQLLSKAC